jgi:2-haloacid dehalogenase
VSGRDLGAITTLVFDVLGTVLDEDAGLLAAAREIPAEGTGAEPAAIARSWSTRTAELLAAVVEGQAPFATIDELQHRALQEILAISGITVPSDFLARLSRFGHRLPPFPDTAAAMGDLARTRAVVALTNAGLSQALDMSAAAGLRWSTLVSAETVGAYKPDDRMYAFAVDRLGIDPGRALFVAAHPWDLDAAARHGFATAYIDRAGSTREVLDGYARSYDVVLADLAALATRLRAPTPG